MHIQYHGRFAEITVNHRDFPKAMFRELIKTIGNQLLNML